MNQEEKNYIQEYLNGHQPFDYLGTKRYSTLVAGLKDCRRNTKRNLVDGVYDETNSGDTGNWLACIGYFTILDQIGSCFRRKGIDKEINPNYNKIQFAIKNFGYELIDNDEQQLHALIALRNAFTHDFNLLNIPKSSKKISLEQHKFTVTDDKNSWVVKLPKEPWDGNIEAKNLLNTNDITLVNLYGFGLLVEKIYTKVCELHKDDELDILLKSTKELINKYTFVIS